MKMNCDPHDDIHESLDLPLNEFLQLLVYSVTTFSPQITSQYQWSKDLVILLSVSSLDAT